MRMLIVPLLVLVGCSTQRELARVQPPQVVTKVIEVRVKLPTWATQEVPKATPATGKVGDLRESHSARGEALDYVNCRSLLLRKIEAGEKVSIKDCAK